MRDPEEAIERVLTRLRDAEAPAGMETRILGALAAQAAKQDSRRSWREAWRGWLAARSHAWTFTGGVTFAGVFCVALVALVVASKHRPGPVAGNGTRMLASLRVRGGAEETGPQRLKPHDKGRGDGTAEAVPLSKTDAALRKTRGSKAKGETEGPRDYDSLAVSEMLAPSRPAPPLPLTKQEKLFAEVVHKGDPEQVADLNPEVRAKQVEVAKAEFHEFFEPVSGNDNE